MQNGIRSRGQLPALHEAHLREYEKLKEEQSHRIHFRDNLRYVNLVAAAVVSSYASSKGDHTKAWLLIPWLTSILAWTYLMNMHQVHRISTYLRDRLRVALAGDSPTSHALFGWEEFRKDGTSHCLRKVWVLLFDELTFVAPAVLALLSFAHSEIAKPSWMWAVFAVDAALALWVFVAIYWLSDEGAQLHKLLRRRADRKRDRGRIYGVLVLAR